MSTEDEGVLLEARRKNREGRGGVDGKSSTSDRAEERAAVYSNSLIAL